MLELIDTHCHLTDRRLVRQAPAVLERAAQAGVCEVVCASGEIADAFAAADLAARHDHVYFTAGVHPHDAKHAATDFLDALESLLARLRCVAIGEIGLDYHYDFSPRPVQQEVFARQLDLARRLGRRVVIHSREALDDTLAILARSGLPGERVIFHSFTEGPAGVGRVLDFGAAVSFSGIVTFPRAIDVRQSATAVPDDRLLIETDAPYLSPEPVRKMKVNEPANVVHVAACLAELRRTSLGPLAELTTANARRLLLTEL